VVRHREANAVQSVRTAFADFVVLQDQSSGPDLDGMYPELWTSLIRPTGAKTVMFMTWGTNDMGGPDFRSSGEYLQQAYDDVATLVGVSVAPVGAAWIDHYRQSDVHLHSSDWLHPAPAGTYLAALVFWSTLTGRTPIGLSTGGLTIDEDLAESLQEIAWDTYRSSPLADVSKQAADVPQDDHGNRRDDATPYTLGEQLDATLSSADADFFKFVVEERGTLEMRIAGALTGKGLKMMILDASNEIIAFNYGYWSSSITLSVGEFERFGRDQVLDPGDYYLRVSGAFMDQTQGSSNYSITSTFHPTP
jgi:hypothetical protein